MSQNKSNKETILIIDDETHLTDTLSMLLETKGYNTEKAYDGLEGLQQLEKINPELIILDLTMPHLSGIDFYNRICNEQNKPKYPVLVFTARGDLEETFEGINIEGFLTKGDTTDILFKKVEDVILKQRNSKKGLEKEDLIARHKNILIVNHNQKVLEDFSSTFTKAGYNVSKANSAKKTEEISTRLNFDIILISSSLRDLSGDDLIANLYHFHKIRNAFFILHLDATSEDNEALIEKIRKKSGVATIIQSSNPKTVLDEVTNFLMRI